MKGRDRAKKHRQGMTGRELQDSEDWLDGKMAVSHRPARIATLLAQSLRLKRMVERGEGTLALIARRLEMTPSRVSQIQDLALLAPDIQREVLRLKAVNDREPVSDRQLQRIVQEPWWEEQRALWKSGKEERGLF